MEKKVNQRVVLTKRLVQEGLLRLLVKEPVETINVSELCREAGINRATFYKHYYSPHDVLSEIESNVAMELEKAQYEIVPKEEATTVSKIEGICTYLKKNANTVKILIKSKMDKDISKVFENVPKEALNLIEKNCNSLVCLGHKGNSSQKQNQRFIFDDSEKSSSKFIQTELFSFLTFDLRQEKG